MKYYKVKEDDDDKAKTQQLILFLTYQKQEPLPTDLVLWPDSKVTKVMCQKIGRVKKVVDKFKTSNDPALTKL